MDIMLEITINLPIGALSLVANMPIIIPEIAINATDEVIMAVI